MGAVRAAAAAATLARAAAAPDLRAQAVLGCTHAVTQPSGAVQGALWDLHRTAELAGATESRARLVNRPSSDPEAVVCGERVPWAFSAPPAAEGEAVVRPTPVTAAAFLNSGYPDDRSNGPVWEGRGLSASVSGGARLRWGPVSAALAPALTFQQNRDYDFFEEPRRAFSPERDRWINYSRFVYARPGHLPGWIDLPQRFGETAFWAVHPGESYVRVDPGFLSAGVSTENLWWGPGLRNSILMSNTGAGFPHLFVGTPGPVDVEIGEIAAEAVWGRLDESDHFDDDPGNDRRLFQAVVVTFSPEGAEGLHLGVARVYYEVIPPAGLDFPDYFRIFEVLWKEDMVTPDDPSGDDHTDQLFGVFGRWVFPRARFEAYGEWSRTDHSWDFEDFASEPDHSQAYTLGLQKLFGDEARWVRVRAELTHLAPSTTRLHRGSGNFYNHHLVTQGYTHRGQMLGAGLGPGGASQYLGVDVYRPWGRLGGFVERYARNEDAYLRRDDSLIPYPPRQDVDLGAGLTGAILRGALLLEWSAAYYHRWHPFYRDATDQNVKLQTGVVWLP